MSYGRGLGNPPFPLVCARTRVNWYAERSGNNGHRLAHCCHNARHTTARWNAPTFTPGLAHERKERPMACNHNNPKPHRVQLSRRKGWRMPQNTKKVDRTTRWGNPFVIGGGPFGRHATDHEGAVGLFREMLRDPELRAAAGYPSDAEIRDALKGVNLACWCSGPHCHADALLEVANTRLATGE